jgi:hypothetical protein
MKKTEISKKLAEIILDKYSRDYLDVHFSNKDMPSKICHKYPVTAIIVEAKAPLAMIEIVEDTMIYMEIYFEDGLTCTIYLD